MTDLERAKSILDKENYACVVVKGDEVITSNLLGVKPLISFVNEGKDLTGYSAADKVVGRAAAFLYSKLNIKCVHAKLISESAFDVLESNGIEYSYEEVVPNILNRTMDDYCPMEKSVLNTYDIDEAVVNIKEAINILMSK